jgi:hypothetical protein
MTDQPDEIAEPPEAGVNDVADDPDAELAADQAPELDR